jgi:hypothetical protein
LARFFLPQINLIKKILKNSNGSFTQILNRFKQIQADLTFTIIDQKIKKINLLKSAKSACKKTFRPLRNP